MIYLLRKYDILSLRLNAIYSPFGECFSYCAAKERMAWGPMIRVINDSEVDLSMRFA